MSPTSLRRWHSYIGLFMAPSLIFFAVTGALQIFNLHEAHGHYKPAVLVEKLSAVHKDQVFEQPREHDEPPPAAPDAAHGLSATPDSDEDEHTGPATLALKVFFLIIAVGVIVSSSIGVWMGFTQLRQTSVAWSLLGAGTLIPVGLLLLA
jgi:hypothetical protein